MLEDGMNVDRKKALEMIRRDTKQGTIKNFCSQIYSFGMMKTTDPGIGMECVGGGLVAGGGVEGEDGIAAAVGSYHGSDASLTWVGRKKKADAKSKKKMGAKGKTGKGPKGTKTVSSQQSIHSFFNKLNGPDNDGNPMGLRKPLQSKQE